MNTLSRFVLVAVFVGLSAPQALKAQSIASTSESAPYPGVRIVEGRTSGPGTDFWAAYISLCHDSVHVDASPYDGYSTSGSWGSSSGAQLAVNGDFFTASPRLHAYGDAVASGSRWSLNRTGVHSDYSGDWYYQRYGWIAFGEDWADFTHTRWVKQNQDRFDRLAGWKPEEVAPDPPPGTQALVSGFPQLVIEGKRFECSSPTNSSCFPDRGDMRERHPRTAMGLTRDRQTFILVVVDGRRSTSAGMYGSELAKLMEDLGAHNAFNLDGGGSSQMWLRGDGTLNRPSGGSARGVVNHWGIFAGSGNGLPAVPGHCDNRWDGLVHGLTGQLERTVDINGDGLADACIRGEDGLECVLAESEGFGEPFDGPAFTDDSGWADVANYSTLRWGDIDGDGLADVCIRANAGIRCYRSLGDGFTSSIAGPELSDAEGFDAPGYYTTLRMADVTGDGLDDICVRHPDGMKCYPSTGDGFEAAIEGPSLADSSGWHAPQYYGTIRVGDVDGDGRDDICARAAAGMRCWLADDEGFAQRIDGPEWSDGNGYDAFKYYSTIRLIDLDGDGHADLCARGPDGLDCHLFDGESFGAALSIPAMSDDQGWDAYSNYSTLRFADVTGDGMFDACARANDGYRCWPFDGTNFGEPIVTGLLRNESGWTQDRYHRSADFADVNADGKADLCARASAGLVCWLSTSDGFEDELILGPEWSDENGFDAKRYYSTMRLVGPIRPVPESPDPGENSDPGPTNNSTNNDSSDPGSNQPDGPDSGDPSEPSSNDAADEDLVVESGCGCASSEGQLPGSALLILALAGFVWARRSPRPEV